MKNVFDYYEEFVKPTNIVEETVVEEEKMFEVNEDSTIDYSADIQKANKRIEELEKMIADMKKEENKNAGIS